jgi:tetratricopeptide (TPR) repeat protein
LHVDKALDLYPTHEPSLLMKAALTSIKLESPPQEDANLKKEPVSETDQPQEDSNLKKEPVSETDQPPTKEELILADYYYTAGKSYFDQGRFSMAKDSWRLGLDLVPSNKQLQKALGSLLANEGLQAFGKKKLEAAIALWEEAIKIDPGNDVIQEYLDKAKNAQKKARSIQ